MKVTIEYINDQEYGKSKCKLYHVTTISHFPGKLYLTKVDEINPIELNCQECEIIMKIKR